MRARRVFCVPVVSALFAGLLAMAGCTSSSKSQPAAPSEQARTDVNDRLDQATFVLQEFRQKIPDSVAARSECVAVIPSVQKGGLIVGVRVGKGFATCRTGAGWSPPAPISIGGGSVGAQVGYESADWMIIATNDPAKQAFLRGKFQVGVGASATAGPVGTGRGASSDVGANTDIVSYSRSRGLFAGAELSGATFEQDSDATEALYGKPTSTRAILEGEVPMPDQPATTRFVAAVEKGFGAMRISSTSATP
jgi:SH3 domain-containing YSC84-like protein 1